MVRLPASMDDAQTGEELLAWLRALPEDSPVFANGVPSIETLALEPEMATARLTVMDRESH